MSKIITSFAVIFATLSVSACNTTPSSTSLVYISDGYVQCETPAMSLDMTRNLLTEVGINVITSHCAHITDLAVISMCGAGGTGIHLHEIASQDNNKATAAGFDNVSKLTEQSLNYEIIDCKL
ncbi:hypothetical protein Q4519_03835 [Motilimonas sp. 1_MG-2023]|uniref:hypothetical protein n=1 Tax=Motilimonas sp. 1_MG-2023 TaxID=3062672 RepID=UPI0026E457EE|nr:hypothetical protein [Motilimonas sp. 1_MG-2023]MDO6524809.1 hypothetical protein [Motilimonas sp. 1_MG-2023]